MERKQCPTCKEDVAVDATRCPHCSSYQKQWVRIVRHPIFLVTFFIGLMTISYLPMFSMFPEYAENPGATVKILESSFSVSKSNCNGPDKISVLGKLENENPESIRGITFNVEFFESNGNTVEFITEQNHNLIVPGNSKSTFKVSGSITTDVAAYHSHEVTVVEAQIGGIH